MGKNLKKRGHGKLANATACAQKIVRSHPHFTILQ